MMENEVIVGKLRIVDNKISIINIDNTEIKDLAFLNTKAIINAINNRKNYLYKVLLKYNNTKNICKCAINYFDDIIGFTLYDFEYVINFKSKNMLFLQYNILKDVYVIPDEIHFKNIKEKYFVDHVENYSILRKLRMYIKKIKNGAKKFSFNFIFIDKYDNEIIAKIVGQKFKKNLINITFFDDTKEQLLLQKASQSEKIELLGEICGGIAHDFNNQLMVVEGSIGLLDKKIDEQHRGYVTNIKNSILQMSLLIKKLVTLSKTEITLMEEVDLIKLIEDVEKNFLYYQNKTFRIIFNTKIDHAIIKGNRTLIESSLINILKNSYDSFEKGNDNVIIISVEQVDLKKTAGDCVIDNFKSGSYIKVSITDNGLGISPEKKNRIFDPFYTTKSNEKKSGLGLPAVLGMVIQHQGLITVTSKLQVGTKIAIYFKVGENVEQLKFDLESERKKIIVIDDEEIVRTILSDILIEIGYDVVAFSDGVEAVNFFKKRNDNIDLIICDMIMPRMNGKEVFYKIKELNNDTKFLLLSGYSNEELDEKFRRSINGFLSKPVSIEILEKTIDNVINM